MLKYRRGDIVSIPFPFIQNYKKGKIRPALIIQNDIANEFSPNLIVVLISSTLPSKQYPMYYYINPKEEQNSGLKELSILKTDIIITIPKTAVIETIGCVSKVAMKQIDDCLRLSLTL